MAQTINIPWASGGGNITLTLDDTSGVQSVLVSSSANTLKTSRSQTITFSTTTGNATAALTVTQQAASGSFDLSFDPSFG